MIVAIKRLSWIGLLFSLLSFSVGATVELEDKRDDTTLSRTAEAQAYYEQIQAVLSQKEFGEKKKVTRWRLKEQGEKKQEGIEEEYPDWLISFTEWIEGVTGFVVNASKVIEVFLWVLFIAVIVYLLVKYHSHIKRFVSGIGLPSSEPDLPTTMFGLDVKKNSIPKDVVTSAQEFWQAGEHRQAIALLLRSSFIKLLHEHNCRFQDSDTEAECCERLEKHVPEVLSQYMHLLVLVWQQIAYAHRPPSDEVFNSLCRQWQKVF